MKKITLSFPAAIFFLAALLISCNSKNSGTKPRLSYYLNQIELGVKDLKDSLSLTPYCSGNILMASCNKSLYYMHCIDGANILVDMSTRDTIFDDQNHLRKRIIFIKRWLDQYNCLSIDNRKEYTMISTNYFDLTYSEVLKKYPDHFDSALGLYKDKAIEAGLILDSCKYKINILFIFSKENADKILEEQKKQNFLIKHSEQLYYYRSFQNRASEPCNICK